MVGSRGDEHRSTSKQSIGLIGDDAVARAGKSLEAHQLRRQRRDDLFEQGTGVMGSSSPTITSVGHFDPMQFRQEIHGLSFAAAKLAAIKRGFQIVRALMSGSYGLRL